MRKLNGIRGRGDKSVGLRVGPHAPPDLGKKGFLINRLAVR